MARSSSVSQTNRSWRGEGDRRRHLKHPQAATPRTQQHRLAEQPCPASPGGGRVGGGWAYPSATSLGGLDDQGQFGLQLLVRCLAAASSPRSLVEVAGLTPDGVLGLPPVHRRRGQPQLGGDHPHRRTGPHQFHHLAADAGSWVRATRLSVGTRQSHTTSSTNGGQIRWTNA
jgi:hypothetical protein